MRKRYIRGLSREDPERAVLRQFQSKAMSDKQYVNAAIVALSGIEFDEERFAGTLRSMLGCLFPSWYDARGARVRANPLDFDFIARFLGVPEHDIRSVTRQWAYWLIFQRIQQIVAVNGHLRGENRPGGFLKP